MADFYYQTSITARGPWLLDRAQLMELDAIINEQWKRLNEYRDKKIEREVRQALPSAIEASYPKAEKTKEKEAIRERLCERIANRYENQYRILTVGLLLRGGKKLVADSVKEAVEHAGTAESEIENWAVELRVCDVHVQLEIDARYDRVLCRVSPESLPESRETFASLRDWISKHQPKRWQANWFVLKGLLWLVWFGWLFGSVAVLSSDSAKPPSTYHTQGLELVKQGITNTNEAKAIEVILALQTGYEPKPYVAKTPKWWLPSVGLGLLACLVFSISPNSNIGLGKSANKVRRWRAWIRLSTVIVPGLVFSSFIWPALADIIKALFK